jgi:hypothetical protein
MILRDCVAGTVELADVAVHAKVLNAELARLIFNQRQIGSHESRTKTGSVFLVDQAAVTAEFAEAYLIKNWNRLHFTRAVVVGAGCISELTNVCRKLGGDLCALCVNSHRFFFDGVGSLEHFLAFALICFVISAKSLTSLRCELTGPSRNGASSTQRLR